MIHAHLHRRGLEGDTRALQNSVTGFFKGRYDRPGSLGRGGGLGFLEA